MASTNQPNILFIMSDDHAAHAISAYGSRINKTPNIDRIAKDGATLNHCYCTNSICTPSRASILTGQHSHKNGVKTLADTLDGRKDYLVQKLLGHNGYQTALVGKWHLGHGGYNDPTGFDHWNVLPGQGDYYNPRMVRNKKNIEYPEQASEEEIIAHDTDLTEEVQHKGYVTDIITKDCLNWLEQRDRNKPFMLMCHHKAPHRPWYPSPKYANLFEGETIPEPQTFNDDYSNRAKAAADAKMRIERDLTPTDLKQDPPQGLSEYELKQWKYQRYIKDYLRCVQSIDDSVGELLDYLDKEGIAENTIVIYTSDQGFFLGDHSWFDKRFMYEQSLQMPFLIRYPKEIQAGTTNNEMLTNNDFAPTFLDYAGIDIPEEMQGASARKMLQGEPPTNWQDSIYYRYWMHHTQTSHGVHSHYGVRTKKYKLIYYYGKPLGCAGTDNEETEPEWELFDLEKDPLELMNEYHNPQYSAVVKQMTAELNRLQKEAGDKPEH